MKTENDFLSEMEKNTSYGTTWLYEEFNIYLKKKGKERSLS